MTHWNIVVSIEGERSKPMLVDSASASGAIRKALVTASASSSKPIVAGTVTFCPAPDGVVVWETEEGETSES